MAIPKKGSRKIIVDNVVYRWRVRKNYRRVGEEPSLLAAVELDENPQGVLSIRFPLAKYYDDWYLGAKKAVSPKHIEECIKNAVGNGWKPDDNENHKISYKDEWD